MQRYLNNVISANYTIIFGLFSSPTPMKKFFLQEINVFVSKGIFHFKLWNLHSKV